MIDQRKFHRLELDDLAAKLSLIDDAGDEDEVDYFPINVSQTGMSIFTSRQLGVNTTLTLALTEHKVALVVKWCRAKENDPALFRCGLEALDSNLALDELIKQELSF